MSFAVLLAAIRRYLGERIILSGFFRKSYFILLGSEKKVEGYFCFV